MTQSLSAGDFEWLEPEEIGKILNYPDDHEYGAIVESYLEFSGASRRPQCLPFRT